MIKIAFIGCDSTHTEAYAKLFNFTDSPFYGKAEVYSIFGEDKEQLKLKANKLKIPIISESINSALNNVDFAMVIGRFGESHFEPAMMALKNKIPVFVDKPFTIDINQAIKLKDVSEKSNVKLCSSSPLRFAQEVLKFKKYIENNYEKLISVNVTVPANCTDLGPDPRLNNSFFYGIHGVEVLLELIGYDFKKIDYNFFDSQIKVIVTTFDNKQHTLSLIYDVSEIYWIDIHTTFESFRVNIDLNETYYEGVANFLINDFIEGKKTIELKSTLTAISILDQIEKNKPKIK
tara:strand:+ start:1718 stop:2587 length:870 start_codon:yes stop_codon:yes gene_type:complete